MNTSFSSDEQDCKFNAEVETKHSKTIADALKIYRTKSSIEEISEEKQAPYITRSIHLNNMTSPGLNNFEFESWKQTFIPVCRYALEHKLFIVSLGCGAGYLESLLVKIMDSLREEMKIPYDDDNIHSWSIICIDPSPQSFNSGEEYMKIAWPTVDEFVSNCPDIKNNCVLILNWATPNLRYDFDGIRALSPQIVLSCFDTWGAAGGSEFHQWMNISGFVHTGLCSEYSEIDDSIKAFMLHEFTTSLSEEELKWTEENKYIVQSLYRSCYRIKDKYDDSDYIKYIKEPTLTIVTKHGVDLDVTNVPQNNGRNIDYFSFDFADAVDCIIS